MSEEVIAGSFEELQEMFGDKIEIIIRTKKGKYKKFVNVLLNKVKGESTNEIIQNLYQQSQKLLANTDKLNRAVNSVKGIQIFNSVVGVMNLCATTAGFAVVCQKLNKITGQIQDVMDVMKNTNQDETMYKFSLVIEDHKEMLDGKDGGRAFSEDKYLELIKRENSLLQLLYRSFSNETCACKLEILQAILALANMMAVAITDFDTMYKFKYTNKKSLYNGHDGWMNTYDMLISEDFKNKLQDFFFIDEDKSQYEMDILTDGVIEKFADAKKEIESIDELLKIISNKEEYNKTMKIIDKSIEEDIDEVINQDDEQLSTLCIKAKNEVGFYN